MDRLRALLLRAQVMYAIMALVLVGGALLWWASGTKSQELITVPDISEEQIETLVPVRIEIPSIGVDATVIEVGVGKDGNMEAPKDVKEVGWYEPGFRPGESGSAVLAGHVNSRLGLPAIFRNLTKLDVGEAFTLYDKGGQSMTFQVTEKNIYDIDNAPLRKIYGPADEPTVTLITCDTEVWLGNTYRDRLVVTAVLVTEESTKAELESKVQ